MSYHPPGEFAHLDAIRYDFSPGEALKATVDPLFQSGTAPDFLLHSTKEAYVDAALHSLHRYSREQEVVNEVVARRQRVPIPIGGAALRRIAFGAPIDEDGHRREVVRLAFLPARPADFHELSVALNRFPDIFPRPEPPRHYLYADFSPHLIRGLHDHDENGYEMAVEDFNKRTEAGIKSGLLSASLERVSHVPKEQPMEALRPGWRIGRDE